MLFLLRYSHLGGHSISLTQFWKMLYKITHFSHIFYMIATPSHAHLQTNNELSHLPVFSCVILSAWTALTLRNSWSTLSFQLKCPLFSPGATSYSSGSSQDCPDIFCATLTLEQLFMEEAGRLEGRGCILALFTLPSVVSRMQNSCSVNVCWWTQTWCLCAWLELAFSISREPSTRIRNFSAFIVNCDTNKKRNDKHHD